MNIIINFIEKNAPIVDSKIFENNEKKQLIAAKFFFYTSKITKFFYFSKPGKIILGSLCAVTFYTSRKYFATIVTVFAENTILDGTKFMVLNAPFFLIFLILSTILLFDIAIINTFLVYSPSINSRIKLLYGPQLIKERFYNSGITTAKIAAQTSKYVAMGIGSGIIGGAITNIVSEKHYSDNYKQYTNVVEKHPELAGSLKPPKKGMFGVSIGN